MLMYITHNGKNTLLFTILRLFFRRIRNTHLTAPMIKSWFLSKINIQDDKKRNTREKRQQAASEFMLLPSHAEKQEGKPWIYCKVLREDELQLYTIQFLRGILVRWNENYQASNEAHRLWSQMILSFI